MTDFFDAIDRHKFGLLAALSVYIGLFMYFEMGTYTTYDHYEPFHEGSYVDLNEEYLEVKPDNIEIPADYETGPVSNMAKDANDTREQSWENYSSHQSAQDVEQSVYDLEKQMYQESGGATERDKITQEMNQREQDKQNQTTTTNTQQSNNKGDNAFKGKTMVEWSLKGRKPYQDNSWYVRNPGYTSYGNGVVLVDIVVNSNGNVTSASYNSSGSRNANQRMIEQALKYAKMSRFNYSGSAPGTQKGTITYTFVSN